MEQWTTHTGIAAPLLRDDINNAVKDAMRAKDERKLSTLRMVNSTIKNARINRSEPVSKLLICLCHRVSMASD